MVAFRHNFVDSKQEMDWLKRRLEREESQWTVKDLPEHVARRILEGQQIEEEQERRALAAQQRELHRFQMERQRMKERFHALGMSETEVPADGNCQFASLSDQLFGDKRFHQELRRMAADWLRKNPRHEVGEDVLEGFLETDYYPTWDAYCDYVGQDGSWGDQLSLIALAEAFKCRIVIVSSVETSGEGQYISHVVPKRVEDDKTVFLSHWHEKHYNSLKRTT